MILFLFEGKNTEPKLFNALAKIFFEKQITTNEYICACYDCNIYSLYAEMTNGGQDLTFPQELISILQNREATKEKLKHYKRSDFSEIYLFFDLDCHHQEKGVTLSYADKNARIQMLLDFFNEETEHGKLYVSYPMVEAFRYTLKLPDLSYYTRMVTLSECNNFKQLADAFSEYGNSKFLTDLRDYSSPGGHPIPLTITKQNWRYFVWQNVVKANYLCTQEPVYPVDLNTISSLQIFTSEQMLMSQNGCVSVLSAFPLFLVEYFGLLKFKDPNLELTES